MASSGVIVTAGCSGGGSDPPQLENAYFNVNRPVGSECVVAIRFALTYDKEPDPDDLDPTETLSVSRGTVVHDDSTDLQWFERFKSGNSDNPLATRDDVPERYLADAEADIDDETTFYGWIENGLQLGAPPASEARSRIPDIDYTEDEVNGSDGLAALQMHDGYTYHFPLADASYPQDGSYDISVGSEEVQLRSVGDDSADLRYEVPDVPSESNLVPSFRHRALPTIPTIRALDQSRAKTLDKWARWMQGTWDADATPPRDNARELNDLILDSASDAMSQIVPTDTAGVAIAVGLQFAPLIGAAAFGPAGFAAGLAVAETVDLILLVDGLNEYAESYTGEFTDNTPVDDFETVISGDQLSPIYQTESESDSASVHSVVSAIRAQARYGSQALATSPNFDETAAGMVAMLEDQLAQLESYEEVLLSYEDLLNTTQDPEHVNRQLNVLQSLIQMTEREIQLLEEMRSNAAAPLNAFREDWDAPTLASTTEPSWERRDVSGNATAVLSSSQLQVGASNGGSNSVATADPVAHRSDVWRIEGEFTVGGEIEGELTPGGEGVGFEHGLRLTDQEGTELLSLTLVSTADQQVLKLASTVTQDQTREVSVYPDTRYAYSISRDENGVYDVQLRSLGQDGATDEVLAFISQNGSPLPTDRLSFSYYTAADGFFTASHDYLAFRQRSSEATCRLDPPEPK